MSEILTKLQIKDNKVKQAANVPAELTALMDTLTIDSASPVSILFIKSAEELALYKDELFSQYDLGEIMWFCYPKKTSKQYKGCDLNREIFRVGMMEEGFAAVRQVSINDDWSAVRMRKLEEIKA